MAGNVDISIEVDGAEVVEFSFAAKPAELQTKLTNFVRDVAIFTESSAKAHVNQRTGNLFKNIAHDIHLVGPGHVVGIVGVRKTAPYGKWVEEGTGLHHPTKPHWIFPRAGNFMVWDEKGAFATKYQGRFVHHVVIKKGRRKKITTSIAGMAVSVKTVRVGQHYRIFAKRTRGQRGQRFMEKAYIEATQVYVPVRIKALAEDTGSV